MVDCKHVVRYDSLSRTPVVLTEEQLLAGYVACPIGWTWNHLLCFACLRERVDALEDEQVRLTSQVNVLTSLTKSIPERDHPFISERASPPTFGELESLIDRLQSMSENDFNDIVKKLKTLATIGTP